MSETFDLAGAESSYPGCPERLLQSLALYVNGRIRPGAFVMACLENDLRAAVHAAGEESYEALPHLIGAIDRYVPPQACGTKEAVAQWLSRKSRKETSDAR